MRTKEQKVSKDGRGDSKYVQVRTAHSKLIQQHTRTQQINAETHTQHTANTHAQHTAN